MIARLVSFASVHAPLRWSEATLRHDWRAGWVSAVIMLPQAVVLAALAGMPPEAGIYTSVFPVIIAAVAGASPRLLSGPNTAVAVMVAAALTPLATPASDEYVALALTLAAMVGAVQLAAAAARLGRMLDAMPDCIVHGVTLGVGVVILVTQLPPILGVLTVPGEAPWVALWYAAAGLSRANLFSVAVASVAILTALVVKRLPLLRGTLLAGALISGVMAASIFDILFGADAVNLDRVGYLHLELLPVSMPGVSWDQLYVLKQLVQSALAIALIGALQTVIIARSVASGDEEIPNSNRELLAQGLANVIASLTSGFAGSGSFNRSAAHVQAGARTCWAAVLSALILFGLVFALGPVVGQIPTAAMAGALVWVGWGLIRSTPLHVMRRNGVRSLVATLAMALLVVFAGLETAVFWGCVGGIAVLVWRRAAGHSSEMRTRRFARGKLATPGK